MQRYLSSEQWRKRPDMLEERGSPQERHSLLCPDCGFFILRHLPQRRGGERRLGYLQLWEQEVEKNKADPEDKGGTGPRRRRGAVRRGTPSPCSGPCHLSRGGSGGSSGNLSLCGAHTSESGSEDTWDKGGLVFPGTGSVLQENKNCPSSPGGSPWLSWQQVLGLANELSCPGFLHSTRVEDAPGGFPFPLNQSGYGCSPNSSEWWPSRLLGREQGDGDSSFSYFNPSRSIGEGAASQNILVAGRACEWYKLLRTLKKRNTLKSLVGLGATYHVDIS